MTKYLQNLKARRKRDMKTLDNVKRRELGLQLSLQDFPTERAHGTAHNISNINVIFTSPVRGKNLTDKDECFETYTW